MGFFEFRRQLDYKAAMRGGGENGFALYVVQAKHVLEELIMPVYRSRTSTGIPISIALLM